MALARTNRTSKSETAGSNDPTPIVTSAFTPSNSSLLVCIAMMMTTVNDFVYTAMRISDSLGTLTWTSRIGYSPASPAFGEFYPNLRIWTAPVTTGASMTASVDGGGGTNYLATKFIALVDYTGYDTGSPIGVTAAEDMATNGADTAVLSGAPASTSEIFGGRGAGVDGTGTISATEGASHTEVYDMGIDSFAGLQVQVRPAGSTSTSFSWADVASGTGTLYDDIGVAIEIKEAAGAAATSRVPPTLGAARRRMLTQ